MAAARADVLAAARAAASFARAKPEVECDWFTIHFRTAASSPNPVWLPLALEAARIAPHHLEVLPHRNVRHEDFPVEWPWENVVALDIETRLSPTTYRVMAERCARLEKVRLSVLDVFALRELARAPVLREITRNVTGPVSELWSVHAAAEVPSVTRVDMRFRRPYGYMDWIHDEARAARGWQAELTRELRSLMCSRGEPVVVRMLEWYSHGAPRAAMEWFARAAREPKRVRPRVCALSYGGYEKYAFVLDRTMPREKVMHRHTRVVDFAECALVEGGKLNLANLWGLLVPGFRIDALSPRRTALANFARRDGDSAAAARVAGFLHAWKEVCCPGCRIDWRA